MEQRLKFSSIVECIQLPDRLVVTGLAHRIAIDDPVFARAVLQFQEASSVSEVISIAEPDAQNELRELIDALLSLGGGGSGSGSGSSVLAPS